jgi:hypothetical protein
VRAVLLIAIRINIKRVISYVKAALCRGFFLSLFNFGIVEILHVTALQANDVVVILPVWANPADYVYTPTVEYGERELDVKYGAVSDLAGNSNASSVGV